MNVDAANNREISYTPSAILNILSNSISLPQIKKVIQCKGIYSHGKGSNYNGYYYDQLRDDAGDSVLTLLVPALIREKLTSGKTIVFNGYITKKIGNAPGRIEIQLNITEIIEQVNNSFSDIDLQSIAIQQEKAKIGFKDVYSFIKRRIIRDEPVSIKIIIGQNAIIDSDIKHQLRDSSGWYNISFHKTSLSSESAIISLLATLNTNESEIICISRGGGENIQLFNSVNIAKVCLTLIPFFLTAIGHKEDVTLVQKIADKAFITPSELGQFLNQVYQETIEELQNSKAKLIETLSKQFEPGFKQQLEQFELLNNKKIADLSMFHTREIQTLNETYAERIKNLNDNFSKQIEVGKINQTKRYPMWLIVLIAVFSFALGYLWFSLIK